MDLLKQVICCAVLASLTWFAFGQDVQGARYLLNFYVWAVLLPLSLLAFASDEWAKNMAKSPPPTATRKLLGRATHGAVLGAMIWTGHGFTATALAVAWLLLVASWHHVDKLRAEASAPAAV